jgi:hypothetical protein
VVVKEKAETGADVTTNTGYRVVGAVPDTPQYRPY